MTITVDCADPVRLAEFWCALLGYERAGGVAQYVSIKPVGGPTAPKMIFQAVPEPKVAKNRLHLDIDLDEGVPLDPEVDRALALGATVAREDVVEEFGLRWQILADPEGNEFCIVAQG